MDGERADWADPLSTAPHEPPLWTSRARMLAVCGFVATLVLSGYTLWKFEYGGGLRSPEIPALLLAGLVALATTAASCIGLPGTGSATRIGLIVMGLTALGCTAANLLFALMVLAMPKCSDARDAPPLAAARG